MDRDLNLLGIARKAGLLAVGGDAVASAARAGKARLVLSASDSSEGALRRAILNAKSCGAVHVTVPYTKFEIGQITGRGSPGTAGILDSGLAASFLKEIGARTPGRFEEDVKRLGEEARAKTIRIRSTRRTAR